MDELKQYIDIVKRNMETMNTPDYEDKDEDLKNQKEALERVEHYLKEKSISPEGFDQIVNMAVEYASNEISLSELEGTYHLLTK
jgi:hypothetical protein